MYVSLGHHKVSKSLPDNDADSHTVYKLQAQTTQVDQAVIVNIRSTSVNAWRSPLDPHNDRCMENADPSHLSGSAQ